MQDTYEFLSEDWSSTPKPSGWPCFVLST